jgi:dipeptidyl aminopeptidase/acylaminoacyl peptidase
MARENSITLFELDGTCSIGHGVGYFDITTDGKTFYFAAETSNKPCEMYRVDTHKITIKPKSLYSCSSELHSIQFRPSELIEWTGTDGKPRRGALILPPDYVEGQ